MTREPHGNDARQNTEHQFQYHCDRKVDHRVAIAAFVFITVTTEKTSGDLRQNARDEDNKGVHNPLDQRHGNHVTVRDMANFVSNNGFSFIRAHVLQQTGTDRNQRGITARPGGKRVNVRRMVDSDLRHGDTGLTRLRGDRIHQPTLSFVTRLLDHFPTDGA